MDGLEEGDLVRKRDTISARGAWGVMTATAGPWETRRDRLRGRRGRMRASVCGETGPGYLTRTEAVSSVQAGRSGAVLAQERLMTHA
jgi:hypothetical protein